MANILQQIKDDVAKEIGHDNWQEFHNCYSKNGAFKMMDKLANKISKLYANQKLEEAAERATASADNDFGIIQVNKQSILNLREEV